MAVDPEPDLRYLGDARRIHQFRKYYQSRHAFRRQSLSSAIPQPSPPSPHSAPDFAISAFAKCVIHSLHVDKVMVSLLDDTTQYFLAGATKHTSSIVSGDEDADLWFGCGNIDIRGGICEIACSVTPTDPNYPFYIIPDIAEVPKWRDVVPGYRFYAGIPIKTEGGHNIGTLFAFATWPRPGLEQDEKLVMERMAVQVARHLELELSTLERQRLLRMNQSLAHFAVGRTVIPSTPPRPIISRQCSLQSVDSQTRDVDVAFAGRVVTFAEPESSLIPQLRHMLEKDNPQHTSEPVTLNNAAVPHSAIYTRAVPMLRSGLGCTGVTIVATTKNYLSHSSDAPVDILASETDSTSTVQRELSGSCLRILLQLYPEGCLFLADNTGKLWPASDEYGADCRAFQPHLIVYPQNDNANDFNVQAQLAANELREAIPGALQLILMPLMNPSSGLSDSTSCAAIAWNNAHHRILSRTVELPFMACFCMNITAEILKEEAVVISQQKADFIANVSHELRSPLHGILASTDLLSSAAYSAEQHALMEDIRSCGRVLLNTIDHVLDFSKLTSDDRAPPKKNDNSVSSFSPASPTSREPSGQRDEVNVLNQLMHVDVASLCEDVVDSVLLSQSFRTSISPINSQGHFHEAALRNPIQPTISLDISHRDWRFFVQPGAIQRIIMNLFGNAIKYTRAGFIAVHLDAQDVPDSVISSDDSKSNVTLVVRDSGCGFTPEYIRTRLWTPFAQEDQTVHGTGLGLAITRRIVQLLGGTINLQSTLNVGTTVTVSIPMKRASRHGDSPPELQKEYSDLDPLRSPDELARSFAELRPRTEGKYIRLFTGTSSCNNTEARPEAEHYADQALKGYLEDWLGFQTVIEPTSQVQVDFVVADEERLPSLDLSRLLPCLIIRGRERDEQLEGGRAPPHYAVIKGPPAPRKLGRAFRDLVRKDGTMAVRSIESAAKDSPRTDKDAKAPADNALFQKAFALPPDESCKAEEAVADSLLSRISVAVIDDHNQSHEIPPENENRERDIAQVVLTCDMKAPATATCMQITTTPNLSIAQDKIAPLAVHITPRVLIVDDNNVNLKVLSAFLRKLDIPASHITLAVNGLDAVSIFTRAFVNSDPTARFGLVLMDLNMPVKDGFDATREIRALESSAAPAIRPCLLIALTGLVSDRDRTRAFNAGVDLFFSKPFGKVDIKRLLDLWKNRELLATEGKG